MVSAYQFIVFILIALFSITSAHAVDQPQGVYLKSVQNSGSGCPTGSASTVLSPDAKSLSILFDQFQVEAGQASRLLNDKKGCSIHLDFEIPKGWSMALFSADYRGFADIEKGTMGVHQVTYRFSEQQKPFQFSAKIFQGPYHSDYLIQNAVPIDSNLSWSSCKNPVNLIIDTDVMARVLGRNIGNQNALMILDSLDGSIEQKFKVAWKRCDEVPSKSMTAVHQFTTQTGGALYTTDVGEGLMRRLRYGGVAFQIHTSLQSDVGLIPIYQCLLRDGISKTISQNNTCQGQRPLGVLGYIAKRQVNGSKALYRFTHTRNAALQLVGTDLESTVRSGYQVAELLGYVQ